VLTRASIHVGALNKGGSGDPGTQSAVGHPAQIQAVSDIYTRDHSRCYLLIVMLLALGGAKVLLQTLKVIRFTFYCYYPFNPFASSLLHPWAYVGCWWDLRRDPFIFLSSHYTCSWCIPGFVWCLDYHHGCARQWQRLRQSGDWHGNVLVMGMLHLALLGVNETYVGLIGSCWYVFIPFCVCSGPPLLMCHYSHSL
jgi:hypothetical protein